jgi:hypothetical protein
MFFGGAFVLNIAQDYKCLGHEKICKNQPQERKENQITTIL